VRSVGFGLTLALTVAACSRSETGTDARYAAATDLGPTIAQLGATEQMDVDTAIERLASFGDAAVPALETAVAKEAKPIGLGALEALGQIGSPRADAVLVAVATEHADPEVRANAILRLGEGGRPVARQVLEQALADPSPMVSRTAAMACGALCTSPDAIDRIVGMGLDGVSDVELPRIRATLTRLLGGADETAAAHARETIRSRTAPILTTEGPLDPKVRAALIAADAGLPDVEPVLLAAAAESKSPPLRAAAMHWLGRSGSAAGVPVLEASLGDASTRAGAAMALQALVGRGVPEAKAAVDRLAGAHAAATGGS
jgi:HEAT repeat protein